MVGSRRRWPGAPRPALRALIVRPGGEAGFTLIEVMLAAALGVVVIMTAAEVLLAARQAGRLETAHSRVLNSASIATSLLARALRGAGYPGCHPALRRDLSADGEMPWLPPVQLGASHTAGSAGETLTIRGMRSLGRARIVAISADGERLQLDRAHGVGAGQQVMLVGLGSSDCLVFRQATTAADVLDRGPGGSGRNQVPAAGYRPLDDDVEILVPAVQRFEVDRAVGRNGVRSLYRRTSTGSPRREELVVGVEALRLRVGIDSQGDGHAERYVAAAAAPAPSDIAAVHVELRIASHRLPGVLARPMRLESGERAPDQRIHRTLRVAVALRNGRP